MPLSRDSAVNFLLFIFWLKCAAAVSGVICFFVHYCSLVFNCGQMLIKIFVFLRKICRPSCLYITTEIQCIDRYIPAMLTNVLATLCRLDVYLSQKQWNRTRLEAP